MKALPELSDLPLKLGAEGGHVLGENERQLWAAAMCLAIADIGQLGDGSPVALKRREAEARQWMADDSEKPRSFRWVCGILDLDPDRLRAAALARAGQLKFHDLSNFSVGGRRNYPTRRQLKAT